MKKTGGRNNKGHLTLRHRGGGHKRQYRKIDFKRNKFGIPGKVAEIEYDPNRSARIALICRPTICVAPRTAISASANAG